MGIYALLFLDATGWIVAIMSILKLGEKSVYQLFERNRMLKIVDPERQQAHGGTDIFRILKRTRGIRRGMQENNLDKNGHKTFFIALHHCHVFLVDNFSCQPKTM